MSRDTDEEDDPRGQWFVMITGQDPLEVRANLPEVVKRRARQIAAKLGRPCTIEIHFNGDRVPAFVGKYTPNKNIRWSDLSEDPYPR